MKEFPKRFNVENKDSFEQMFYDRQLCYLRRAVFEHGIKRKDENDYFDLDVWCRNNLNNKDMMEKMKATIIEELTTLGWKCKKSFGGTGLFYFSTPDPPPSCWDEPQ